MVYLFVVIMLVNINDVFIGIINKVFSEMVVNDFMVMMLLVYDVGMEVNSEVVGIILGFVDGGEGFNVECDDVDIVSYYLGVVFF